MQGPVQNENVGSLFKYQEFQTGNSTVLNYVQGTPEGRAPSAAQVSRP